MDSLFHSKTDSAARESTHQDESPELSPKATRSTVSPDWTSINGRRESVTSPPPPNNSRSVPLSNSLLTEPRTLPATSWRGLGFAGETPAPAKKTEQVFKMPTGAHDHIRVPKRRISPEEREDADYVAPAYGESSESDDTDIVLPPVSKKRKRREDTAVSASAMSSTPSSPPPRTNTGTSTKYTAADVRAAQALLDLSYRDSLLAKRPQDTRGQREG